jgi:hypothetical protein
MNDYEHLDPHTAAVRQTVDEYLAAPTSEIELWHTYAPEAIGALTHEFWGRRQHRRWFFYGGCFFWLLFVWIVAAAAALKITVYLTAVALVCAAQLFSWGADLFMYPFRARQLADARHDRQAARHAH